MRTAAAAVAFAIGCGAPMEPAAVEPGGLIAADDFTWRMSGLRATLARSGVAMDDAPIVRTCAGDHSAPGECMQCDVATRADTRGVDPDLIDRVAIAFARYPSKVLSAAGLEHVALCSRIREDGGDPDRGPAGLADLAAHRILISIEHFAGAPYDPQGGFTIEQVVHHEVFHTFDFATLGAGMLQDRTWRALNPRGFAYRDPADDVERPAGFVDAYATTDEMEDRASVFEYLMGHPFVLCELAAEDRIVARKAAVVWRRVAAVAGDAYLMKQAACLRDKPKAKRKPAAAPRPRRDPRNRWLWTPKR